MKNPYLDTARRISSQAAQHLVAAQQLGPVADGGGGRDAAACTAAVTAGAAVADTTAAETVASSAAAAAETAVANGLTRVSQPSRRRLGGVRVNPNPRRRREG